LAKPFFVSDKSYSRLAREEYECDANRDFVLDDSVSAHASWLRFSSETRRGRTSNGNGKSAK
jgi:hypothetical protein